MQTAKNGVSPLHQQIIEATLAFANQPSNSSTSEVEALFMPFARDRFQSINPSVMNLKGEEAAQAETGGRSAFTRDRRKLRDCLDEVIEDPHIALQEGIARLDLDTCLQDKAHPRLGFEAGKIVIRSPGIDGVEAGYMLGLALLFEADMATRLRRCEECSNYFVIWHGRKHRQQYCSAECSKDAESQKAMERVRRHRERKKQSGGT